jgi:hypothetical protein
MSLKDQWPRIRPKESIFSTYYTTIQKESNKCPDTTSTQRRHFLSTQICDIIKKPLIL